MARPALRALLAGVLLAAAVSPAHALKWPGGVKIKSSSTGVPVWSGAVSQGATASTGGGAASMTATQLLNIGGVAAEVGLSRGISVAGVARVAAIGARALGPVALLGLAYEGVRWYSGQWEKEPAGGGGWVYSQSYWKGSQPGCYGQLGPELARCNAMAAHHISADKLDQCEFAAPVGNSASGSCRYIPNGNTLVSTATFQECDEGLVFLPTFVCGSDPGGGGSGEWAPATDAELQTSIATALQQQPSLAGAIIDHLKNRPDVGAALLEELQPQVATGPATVPGPVTTTTTIDTAGTTERQVATTYQLAYQGDTVTVTEQQVTTTTDPANNVTTEMTTTAEPAGDPPPPEEPFDLCIEHPDASGCAPFGTPEPAAPLDTEDRTVSVTPEMTAAGSCPSPQAFTIAGKSFQLKYDGACSFATGIRPVVLGVAWLSAFVFLFSMGRAQSS